MPFSIPWTDVEPAGFATQLRAYHWRCRADFSVGAWSLNLAVFHEGDLVGVQGLEAKHYLVTRSGETGSWLGQAHQGRGIGTAMRQAMCAFAFDHLDAAEVTSGAFLDNPASRAVSRKVGYRVQRRACGCSDARGSWPSIVNLVLGPHDLVRGEHPLEVERTGGVPTLDRPGFVACPRAWQNRGLSSVPFPDPLIRAARHPEFSDLEPHPVPESSPTTTSEETPQTWPSRSV